MWPAIFSLKPSSFSGPEDYCQRLLLCYERFTGCELVDQSALVSISKNSLPLFEACLAIKSYDGALSEILETALLNNDTALEQAATRGWFGFGVQVTDHDGAYQVIITTEQEVHQAVFEERLVQRLCCTDRGLVDSSGDGLYFTKYLQVHKRQIRWHANGLILLLYHMSQLLPDTSSRHTFSASPAITEFAAKCGSLCNPRLLDHIKQAITHHRRAERQRL